MRQSLITSNIIHQILDKDINVVYAPSHSVFDQILYTIDCNFFVFGPYNTRSDKCISLEEEYIDLHEYDLFLCNNITDANKNKINLALHVNTLILQHTPKEPQLKKEDLVILNKQFSKFQKIFFDEQYLKSWNQINSIYIPYGIPLDIFTINTPTQDRKPVGVLANDILANQIISYLQSKSIECERLDTKSMNLEEINESLNKYKVVINLSIDRVLSLSAVACGCKVITMGMSSEAPNLYSRNSIEDILSTAEKTIQDIDDTNIENARTYISTNYDLNLFKVKMFEIVHRAAKREGFIL